MMGDMDKVIPQFRSFLGGLENNVTTAMSIDLSDIANEIRDSDEIVEKLKLLFEKDSIGDMQEVYAKFDEENEKERTFILLLKDFMKKFGFRGLGEVDFTNKSFEQDPTFIVHNILMNIEQEGSARRRFEESKKNSLDSLDEYIKGTIKGKMCLVESCTCGFVAHFTSVFTLFNRLLSKMIRFSVDYTRYWMSFREHPKYYTVKVIREFVKDIYAVSEVLIELEYFRAKEDIHWFTLQELRQLLGNIDEYKTSYIREFVDFRKEEYERFKKFPFSPILLNQNNQDLDKTLAKKREQGGDEKQEDGVLWGIGASSGEFEGRVKVILSSRDIHLIEEGDILVTRSTDPSWTACFGSVSALVIAVGGPMTHGSVIARELGIPAVVGVENCTSRLKTGQIVKINGLTGKIVVVDDGTGWMATWAGEKCSMTFGRDVLSISGEDSSSGIIIEYGTIDAVTRKGNSIFIAIEERIEERETLKFICKEKAEEFALNLISKLD